MSNAVNSALARTNWQMLAQQKQYLVRLLSEPNRLFDYERKKFIGLIAWIDALQDAAEAEGYPVEFLAE